MTIPSTTTRRKLPATLATAVVTLSGGLVVTGAQAERSDTQRGRMTRFGRPAT